ncbi:MAG TPA: hypothetical protein VF412_18350 [Bdellovibrio sp.]|uniref:hypothetical protein n=1 Tax=Bdellovibrio sp. TaxID=28201 RepID=UPI002EF61EA0
MSTKKILEFSSSGPSIFCQFLQHLAKQHGWDLQYECHSDFSLELLQNFDIAKVDMSFSEEILTLMHVQPTLVRTVRCLDSLIFEDGKWYPRLLLHEALRRVLVDNARDLDIRVPAFVIGESEVARTVASVFAEVGFGEIYVVGQSAEKLSAQMEILKRGHFGIQFHQLLEDELTIQSLSSSIIVNTVDLTNDKTLLNDLSYFNFMKRDGYALDLNLLPFQNPLLEEAERADLRVLHPYIVSAFLTELWLEKLQMGTSLKVEELRESWKSFLKEISPSV